MKEKKLNEEDRKFFREMAKEYTEPLAELARFIVDEFFNQSEEIREEVLRAWELAFEEGEDGNWFAYIRASLELMDINPKLILKILEKESGRGKNVEKQKK